MLSPVGSAHVSGAYENLLAHEPYASPRPPAASPPQGKSLVIRTARPSGETENFFPESCGFHPDRGGDLPKVRWVTFGRWRPRAIHTAGAVDAPACARKGTSGEPIPKHQVVSSDRPGLGRDSGRGHSHAGRRGEGPTGHARPDRPGRHALARREGHLPGARRDRSPCVLRAVRGRGRGPGREARRGPRPRRPGGAVAPRPGRGPGHRRPGRRQAGGRPGGPALHGLQRPPGRGGAPRRRRCAGRLRPPRRRQGHRASCPRPRRTRTSRVW